MAKHRRQTRTQRLAARAVLGIVPITAIASGSAVAHADAVQFIAPQPGVTNPNPAPKPDAPGPQPGTAAPQPAKPVQPTQYVSPEDDAKGVAPDTDYAQYREVPQRDYTAPLAPEKLHAPEPTPQVAEIVPPARVLRAGNVSVDAPDFLSADQIDQINAAPAAPEAQISQFARSLGVAPSRADAVAAGAVGGAVTGALIGCAIGSTLQIVTVIAFPLTPLTCLTWGATGGIAGAFIGAGQGGLQ
ncbi:hypothetical protein ACFXHA_23530 [Nocardia sp. NPDC059240]|uniref:hypothetical protein n=1 Tax=Nocardia sp. NPDC059240 TaxID=3346786 RepID=UPI0036CDEBBE